LTSRASSPNGDIIFENLSNFDQVHGQTLSNAPLSPPDYWLSSVESVRSRQIPKEHIMPLAKESELHIRWAELQELEQNVIELIATALKLAPGLERRDDLAVIGSFRMRIAAMKRAELARARNMQSVAQRVVH
jgi:hypothetical protein